MRDNIGMKFITFAVIIFLVAILAWFTLPEDDPCANPQSDISGAVLADSVDDQDALVNRAIIMKANCDEP